MILALSLTQFTNGSPRSGGLSKAGDPHPYFHPHTDPKEPNYGPVMVSNLPVHPHSSAEYGSGGSMDAYLAQVDKELERQSSEQSKPRQRSMLRADGWVETKPGDEIDIPLPTASPNIPPEIIEYFEKSRKNDLALAAAVEKAENDKINKELYWVRNKLDENPWKDEEGSSKPSRPGRRRSLIGNPHPGKSGGNFPG